MSDTNAYGSGEKSRVTIPGRAIPHTAGLFNVLSDHGFLQGFSAKFWETFVAINQHFGLLRLAFILLTVFGPFCNFSRHSSSPSLLSASILVSTVSLLQSRSTAKSPSTVWWPLLSSIYLRYPSNPRHRYLRPRSNRYHRTHMSHMRRDRMAKCGFVCQCGHSHPRRLPIRSMTSLPTSSTPDLGGDTDDGYSESGHWSDDDGYLSDDYKSPAEPNPCSNFPNNFPCNSLDLCVMRGGGNANDDNDHIEPGTPPQPIDLSSEDEDIDIRALNAARAAQFNNSNPDKFNSFLERIHGPHVIEL
ncbi:hypothetical protein R3P38DRAFT_2777051 [Favolaschia claudopus]|uniref:Uncharacterized protein n=1 Tax=Favolaschia claudopus TaxID=2862362 RepID=A0AAW0BN97_9AGAR